MLNFIFSVVLAVSALSGNPANILSSDTGNPRQFYGYDMYGRPALVTFDPNAGHGGGVAETKILGAQGDVFVPVAGDPKKIRIVNPRQEVVTAKDLGLTYLRNYNEDPEPGKPLPKTFKVSKAPTGGDIGTFVTIGPDARLEQDFSIQVNPGGRAEMEEIHIGNPQKVTWVDANIATAPSLFGNSSCDAGFEALLRSFVK